MILFQLIIRITMINFCTRSSLSLPTQAHTTNKLRLTSHLSAKLSYWQRLGEPKTVAAPMVAQSDLAFRRLVRNHGTDLAFTQMIHAHNFVSSKAFQDSYLDVYKDNESIIMTPSGLNALEDIDWDEWRQNCISNHDISLEQLNGEVNRWSSYQESGPLVVQIAGHDPDTLSKAAQIILERTNRCSNGNGYEGPVSGIDVNCGCPQGIARKGRYGAFLMEESLDTVCNIITRLREDLPINVGVSCKIRIPNEVGTPEGNAILKHRVERLIDAGCELITVHGRTLKENKTAVRECNWDAIAQVVRIAKQYSGYDYPIIANGGIEFSSDVSKCLEYTGAKAVMSSESLLENPALFNDRFDDGIDLSPKDIFNRQIRLCHEYLDFCTLYPPLPGSLGKVGGAFNCIRAHLFKMLYRYFEEQHDLRSDLGSVKKITSIQGARNLLFEMEKRYADVNWESLRSSDIIKSSWYRRHRNAMETHKMHMRGMKVEVDSQSIEDKKIAIQKRIAEMKAKRAISVEA